MWNREDRAWRRELWEHVLDMLPVELLVNLSSNSFSVRARGEASIYADDMGEEQYEQMLKEWAHLLGDGGRPLRELNAKALRRAYANGARRLYCEISTNRGLLAVTADFPGDPASETFSIRIGEGR